ncbi:dTDP-4-amino-4,6-dideoxygalactose transaminase [Patescibacteria group bacterium]|nr:dTDP-4-amino-4,6-dideoxygalactose transaminase [Patescibacteria group bacterium]
MIPFNIPTFLGKEKSYLLDAIDKLKLCGDGSYTKKCQELMEKKFHCKKVLLTTSCSHALDMSAILIDVKEGDEVIMPSYTFVSTANAFVLRGAKVVFVDIRPDTMNIDENLIEEAITEKTKAIVVVHYAGVGCEMDTIIDIGKKYNLKVIEDAAQGVNAKYNGKYLGTIGDIGCYSFHETKNYTCGEGGALLLNDEQMIERAEIIREKGTNRAKFFRGQVDKYSWVDIGSSFLPSELNAAYLLAQLEDIEKVNERRLSIWNMYRKKLNLLDQNIHIEFPFIPSSCKQNGHMFYIKVKDLTERQNLIDFLKNRDIMTVFHYIPLHSSKAGKKNGRFFGKEIYTTKESEKLLRLPMFYSLCEEDIDYVSSEIINYYKQNDLSIS